MAEFKFVLKAILIAVFLTLGLHMEVRERTLASHLDQALMGTYAGEQVRRVVSGGVYLVNDSAGFIRSWWNPAEPKELQKASEARRINFELKRSGAAQAEHNETSEARR